MESITLQSMSSTIAAALLALVFASALLHKLSDVFHFQGVVRDFQLLPQNWAVPISWAIIAAESAGVLLILLPATRSVGGLLAMGLLMTYGIAIGTNLSRGRYSIDCGCGSNGQGISGYHLLRNSVYAGIGLMVVLIPPPVSQGIGLLLISALCTSLLWIVLMVFEQLLSTKSHIIVTDRPPV